MNSIKMFFELILLVHFVFNLPSDNHRLPEITITSKPWTYWWWMGSAVDTLNIRQNLFKIHTAGIGGVHIVPIYGVKGYEGQFLDYLSPEWQENLDFTLKEANRLGLGVDITTGTGWPFGGPMVTMEDADMTFSYSNGELSHDFSGRFVKRAAPGGEGMALNPYSKLAITNYLTAFDSIFSKLVHRPRAMYHDSFEYKGNWSGDLLNQFKYRRGYDLNDYLPYLIGIGESDSVERVKADYRATLSELHLEYIETWAKWSEKHGFITRNQAHGAPANLLDLYGAATIPETETFGSTIFKIPGYRRESSNTPNDRPQPLINKMASSSAHVMQKSLVSSETFTWLRNHYTTSLSQMKPEIDQLFLQGINHVFFHGTVYSPTEEAWPGWSFYASVQYNPNNPVWRDAKYLNQYISNCQSVLQSGDHDNDIALYWPVHDIWHDTTGVRKVLSVHNPEWLTNSQCGIVAKHLEENGFSYDFISDKQLQEGRASGYKTIIIPKTNHIPIATIKSILSYKDEMPVFFIDSLPKDVVGLNHHQERKKRLISLLKEVDELVVNTDQMIKELIRHDIIHETMRQHGVQFIRRKYPDGHYYFIANLGRDEINQWVKLGVPHKAVTLFDPLSGKVGDAKLNRKHEFFLQLLPGETRIIKTHRELQTKDLKMWPVYKSDSREFEINGQWRLEFLEGGPVLPGSENLTELVSWTTLGDSTNHSFSGTAVYTLKFKLPDVKAQEWFLSLEDVRESARVYINDQGPIPFWSVPFRNTVGEYLQRGVNELRVEVTNSAANRIRYLDRNGIYWKKFHDINLVDHNYNKFDASQWKLAPSGLIGKVTLQPAYTSGGD